MKVCPNCGTQNFETCTVCEKCKQSLPKKSYSSFFYQESPSASTAKTTVVTQQSSTPSALSILAKVFMILSSIAYAVGAICFTIFWIVGKSIESNQPAGSLLALGSLIPMWIFGILTLVSLLMTIVYFKNTSNKAPISTRFKICTLLFINPIAGILMLCDSNNGQKTTTTVQTVQTIPQEKNQTPTEELKEYKALLDSGVITKEEFEKKKQQILGL